MLLSLEIGGTKLQLVLGDDSANIVERRRLRVERNAKADALRAQIEQSLPGIVRAHKIAAVGVGFGGPVDWHSGRIARSHQIEGWSDFDLAEWLRGLAAAPVWVENDANAGALGEASRGAGVGFNSVFYVTLGSGVGGGLVVDGKIFHGDMPGESEIGHVRLDRAGTILESRCSGWAVDARIRELQTREPNCLLAKLSANPPLPPPEREFPETFSPLVPLNPPPAPPRRGATPGGEFPSWEGSGVGWQEGGSWGGTPVGGEAKLLSAALEQGDAHAARILQETAADLAFGLSHVVHLFHPAVIILGGGLSKIGEPLRAAVESSLTPLLMEVFQPGPPVRLAALGEDAVPVGALRLAALALAGASDFLL